MQARRQTHIQNVSVCTVAHILYTYIYSMKCRSTRAHAEMQTHTHTQWKKKKEKIGCVCKQSPHQSLHERSKSTLAVAPFHAIPQLSYTIPTSHLHIKQGSHSHALTNDSWMLLALHITTALQTCAVLPPYVEAKKKKKKKEALNNSSLIATGQGLVLLWTGLLAVGVLTIFGVLAQQCSAAAEPTASHSRAVPAKSGGGLQNTGSAANGAHLSKQIRTNAFRNGLKAIVIILNSFEYLCDGFI